MKSRLARQPISDRRTAENLIYVVDDEPTLLDYARRILETDGYAVRTFKDGQSALECFRRSRRRPALILTDYMMEPMSGLALTQACRRINPHQKIVLISGTADASIYANIPDKPNRHMAKPYHVSQLRKLVHGVMQDRF